MARRDDPPAPLPPADLAIRDLPTQAAAGPWTRIHPRDRSPLHFGRSGHNRFDSPDNRYGVLYLAVHLEGAFAETFLRRPGLTLIDRTDLESRAVSVIDTLRDLRLVQLHGPGLTKLGATAAVSSGSYRVSQAWAAALHRHPSAPDGILYRSRHDDDQLCAAVFDRGATALKVRVSENLFDESNPQLVSVLDRYGVGLV